MIGCLSMATKQLSSNKNIEQLEADVRKARLQNMAKQYAKPLAIILKLAIKGEKLKKGK